MDIQVKYNENEPTLNALMDELQDLFEDEQQPQGGGNNGNGNGDKEEQKQQGGAGGEGNDEETTEDTTDDGKAQPKEELSDRQKKQLQKALEKQREFQDGQVKKTKMSKRDKNQMKGIEESNASVEEVPGAFGGNHNVVVIRKITENNRGVCDMYGTYTGYYGCNDDVIANGFRLGTMLGKKLRVRNDDITTQYNRQRRGNIDRRLLAEIGVGNSKIFEKSYVTTSNDAGIHISIDASGSMGGKRFQNAMTTAIAVAKAADMVGGVRVRIDLRSDCSAPGLNQGMWGGPVVMVVYDSKENNMTHIKKNFPYLRTGGGTPEGVCFAAIKDIITQGGKNTDRYFINMSDGCPCSSAVPITTKEVKNYKASGLKVMSYFIGSGEPGNSTRNTFDGMYGKDSTQYIDTTNITQIAKTLNKLLSERG